MAPSQATTALPLSPSLLSPKEDEAVEPKSTPPPPPDPAANDGGSSALGGPHDDALDDFRVVKGRGGQLTLPHHDAASGLDGDDAMPPMQLTPTAAQRNNNPFAILRTKSSGTETTPLPIHPRPANTLRKIVEDNFNEMFGDITNCPADDTRFWLRAIFREGARLVDSMVSEVQGETVHLSVDDIIMQVATPVLPHHAVSPQDAHRDDGTQVTGATSSPPRPHTVIPTSTPTFRQGNVSSRPIVPPHMDQQWTSGDKLGEPSSQFPVNSTPHPPTSGPTAAPSPVTQHVLEITGVRDLHGRMD